MGPSTYNYFGCSESMSGVKKSRYNIKFKDGHLAKVKARSIEDAKILAMAEAIDSNRCKEIVFVKNIDICEVNSVLDTSKLTDCEIDQLSKLLTKASVSGEVVLGDII